MEKDLKEAKKEIEELKEEVTDPMKLLDKLDPKINDQTKSS